MAEQERCAFTHFSSKFDFDLTVTWAWVQFSTLALAMIPFPKIAHKACVLRFAYSFKHWSFGTYSWQWHVFLTYKLNKQADYLFSLHYEGRRETVAAVSSRKMYLSVSETWPSPCHPVTWPYKDNSKYRLLIRIICLRRLAREMGQGWWQIPLPSSQRRTFSWTYKGLNTMRTKCAISDAFVRYCVIA